MSTRRQLPAVPETPRVPVPMILDAAGVMTFFGVGETMAAYLMRQCPRRIEPEGKRKVFVYTEDLMAWLRAQEVAA